MTKNCLIVIIIFVLQGCGTRKTDSTYSDLFKTTPLSVVGVQDTLKITVERSDCGEFGGNKERLYLFQENHLIKVRYIADTVNCEEVIEINGIAVLDDLKRVIIADSTIELNSKYQKEISKMLQRMLEIYLEANLPFSSGDRFEIVCTDKSFYLDFWNPDNMYDTYFFTISRELFGEVYK